MSEHRVADRVMELRIQGIEASQALAMAADEMRREKIEREANAAASQSIIDRARQLAQLPQLESSDE